MSADILAWHFLPADMRLGNYDGRVAVVGETLTVDPARVKVGYYGLHGSTSALEALRYAPGPIACRVRLSGVIARDGTLVAASERTVIAAADATAVLREFACRCAESVLHLTSDAEPTCLAAIDAARAFSRGEINAEQLDTARYAAWAARYAARYDARNAAWAAEAARDAARDAATEAAMYAARYAARDAARYAADWATAMDAAIAAQEAMLTSMLNELLGLGESDER